jgi:mono/diheme cytochrome c family protein
MTTCLLVAAIAGGTTIGTVSTAGSQESSPVAAASTTASTPGGQGRSIWDGVYTLAQATRGEELYTAHCASCHRDSLDGEGPAKPLIGPSFLDNWNGLTIGAMAERTRTTMPFNQPATLSRQQIVDVLAFMLRANKFPAGETELPRQNEMLEQIKFLAVKP